MKDGLQVGLEHTLKCKITREKTVPFLYPEAELFTEMPEVFATGFMVGFIEWACMAAIKPFLEDRERTVGTMIDVTHEAATPPGMEVTARVRCTKVEGKGSTWDIEVRDETDLIARGSHSRFVVNIDKFAARLEEKRCAVK